MSRSGKSDSSSPLLTTLLKKSVSFDQRIEGFCTSCGTKLRGSLKRTVKTEIYFDRGGGMCSRCVKSCRDLPRTYSVLDEEE